MFHDQGATDALLKQVKGGFLSQPPDQVAAAATLIEGGHAAGFDFAGKFLSKKRKDEELDLALEPAVVLGRRGDLSGLPVLKEMTEKTSLGGALKLLASGKSRPDPDSVKMEVAEALARIDKPEVVPMLNALLSEKSAAVRSSAAEALATWRPSWRRRRSRPRPRCGSWPWPSRPSPAASSKRRAPGPGRAGPA